MIFSSQNRLQYRRSHKLLMLGKSLTEGSPISQHQYSRILKLIHQKKRPLQQSQNRKLLLPKLNDQTLPLEKKTQNQSRYISIQLQNQSKQYLEKTQIEKQFLCRTKANYSAYKHKNQEKRQKSQEKIIKNSQKHTICTNKFHYKLQSLIEAQRSFEENDDYQRKNKQKSLNKAYVQKLKKIIEDDYQKPRRQMKKVNSIESQQSVQTINISSSKETSIKQKKGHLSSTFFEKQKQKIQSFLKFFKNTKMLSIEKQNLPIQGQKNPKNIRISTEKHLQISRTPTIFLTEDGSQENQRIAAKYRLKANHRHLIQYQKPS